MIRSSAILALSACALLATGCSKPEQKVGNLTQRFSMIDSEGRNFGIVELDPISGGSIIDIQGRMVGRVVPPAPAVVATAAPVFAPIPGAQ